MSVDITPTYEIIPAKDKVIVPDTTESFGNRFGGLQAGATSVQQGSGDSVFKADEQGIYLGSGTFASAPFSVTMAGALHATSGTFSGDITGATGTFSGTVTVGSINIPDATSTNSFHVDSSGNMWLGATTLAGAPASITKAGLLTATNVVVTGTVNATGGYVGSTTALIYEAQGINTGTTGHIRGGQTAYSTGSGYFLGYESGAYKFSIGDGGTTYYMEWDGTILTINGRNFGNEPVYGDGSDGAVTISGDTTLTRDMFYTTLTVNSGFTLNTGGFRVFAKTSVTVNGTIARNGNAGNNGTNGTGGGAGGAAGVKGTTATDLAAGSLYGAPTAVASGNGGAGAGGGGASNPGVAGTTGTDVTSAISGNGVAGGQGGNGGLGAGAGSVGAGGGAGSAGTATASGTLPRSASTAILMIDTGTTVQQLRGRAGTGGSGGGGSGSGGTGVGAGIGGGGGGGGSHGTNGGIIVIVSPTITVSGTGAITVNGAAGGNGGNGGTGGNGSGAGGSGGGGGGGAAGSGGGGGVIALFYGTYTNSGSVTASGGAAGSVGTGGAGGTGGSGNGGAGDNGSAGTAGSSGVITTLQLQ